MGRTEDQSEARLNRPLALLVAATFFMENLDGTIIATAAPAMAHDLGVAAVDINIAMTAYLITIAVAIPATGWLTDKLGGRRILMLAIAIFTIASGLCAISTSLPMLCAMRVLQGLGGAMMVPVGRLVVLRTTPKKDLLDAVALITWPALVAPVIAPALGGWLATYASWQWIFLINLPLGAVAMVVAQRIVPALRTDKVPPLDWPGFLLCGSALASLLLGMELVGAAQTRWLLVLGLVLLAVLLGVVTVARLRRVKHPLLDLEALKIRTFAVCSASGMVYRLVISAAPFLLPLMFQLGFGWSPVNAGLMVLMLFAGNIGIKPVTSPLIRRFGFRTVIIGSSIGGALAFAGCGLLGPDTSPVIIAVVLFASGVFRSIGFSGYNSLQFADVEPAKMSAANTLSSTIQQAAGGMGIAFGALILRLSDGVINLVAPDWPLVTHYQATFAILALIMLYPVLEAWLGLHRTAGSEVSVAKSRR